MDLGVSSSANMAAIFSKRKSNIRFKILRFYCVNYLFKHLTTKLKKLSQIYRFLWFLKNVTQRYVTILVKVLHLGEKTSRKFEIFMK